MDIVGAEHLRQWGNPPKGVYLQGCKGKIPSLAAVTPHYFIQSKLEDGTKVWKCTTCGYIESLKAG